VFFYPETKFILVCSRTDDSYIEDKSYTWIPVLISISFVFIVAYVISKNLLMGITNQLVLNLRKDVYISIVNKPIEFFDEHENSSKNLTSFLSSEIEAVNGASIEHYLVVYQGLICMITCTILSFLFNLVIGLYGLLTFPVS
jgi:ABC-type siderophore export system fused ATPase/permease subunit